MALSAEEQERLWEEAERLELEQLKAEATKKSVEKQHAAQALHQTKSVDTNMITPGNITDIYEFQMKDLSFGMDRANAVILGEGAYARVLRARHLTTHSFVAVKEVIKDSLKDKEHVKLLKKEVQLLKESSHPHILEFKQFYECDDYFDIVTEEAEGGELHDRLTELTDQLEEDVVKNIAFNLLDAIAFLQERNIAHRDIKPENILLRKPKGVHGDILLCDFGFATKCVGKSLRKNCGSTSYMAPEVLRNQYYDFRCDIWSVGALLFELFCGEKLFNGPTDVSKENAVKKSPLFAADISEPGVPISDTHPLLLDASLHARQVICACLDPVQERRPLAKQLLEHAWFEGMVPKSNKNAASFLSTSIRAHSSISPSAHLSDQVKDARHGSQQVCHEANKAVVEALSMLAQIDNIVVEEADGMPKQKKGEESMFAHTVLDDFKAPQPVRKEPLEEPGLFEGIINAVTSMDIRY